MPTAAMQQDLGRNWGWLALLLFIAAWAFVMGLFQIAAAFRLRKAIRGEWLLGLSGVLSVIFDALVFLNPGQGALAPARCRRP